ncbi:MAG: discoidin domain-containing protein [Alphaproteobacteria bacterium]
MRRTFLQALLVTLAASVAFAMSVRGAATAEFQFAVRSIDEVTDGAAPTVTDLTTSEGVLVFDSTVPLVCSVVYGETPEFGMIATDADMGGTAHTDHHAVLVGLKPDTEYFYRVQGAGADGAVYVGEVMTFRTPKQVTARGRENLASLAKGARVMDVSSNYGDAGNDGSWGANSAIDGRRTTAWSTNGDGNDGFIEIELARDARLGEVEVWSRSMNDGTARILSFTLTTDEGEVLGPFELADTEQAHSFPVDVTTGTLRLDVVESSGGNVGLIEFGAYPAE